MEEWVSKKLKLINLQAKKVREGIFIRVSKSERGFKN